jgi:hypothetical protein
MALDLDALDRYGRQLVLGEWGAAGQERLAVASATVQGRGRAAELAVMYLAGAGVARVAAEAFVEEARALNPRVVVVALDAADAERTTSAICKGGTGAIKESISASFREEGSCARDPEEFNKDKQLTSNTFPTASKSGDAVRVTVDVGGERRTVAGAIDHPAVGAAVAVEALKALLGMEYRAIVTLPEDLL